MVSYIDYLNDLRVKNKIRGDSSMLVYDSFRGHLEKLIKEKFRESGIHLAVIPGGLTSVCQPLDVLINKPFKDNLRKEWHEWMASGGAGETAAGNLHRTSFSNVCLWVKRAQEGISTEVIIESFKKCKLSNDLGSDSEVSDYSISNNIDRDIDVHDINDDDDIDDNDDDEINDNDEVIGEDM